MSATILDRLRRETRRLRQRLAEAEATLEAIRSGAVDALVISRPDGAGIYTLTGSETPYRHFVEAMGEGAVTLAPDGTIAYANGRFALMVRTPLDRVVAAPILRFIGPSHERTFPAAVARCFDVARSGESLPWTAGEFSLRASDGAIIPVFASITALPMGDQIGAAVIVLDITEAKQAEEALQQLNTVLERRVAERTQDLAVANETIQAQVEELATANEELATANEELRVGNDELQATNDALREQIAAREAAERALAEAKEHYRTVADFTYDWEFWRAPDGGFLYVSPAAQRVTGYTAGEFIEAPGLFLGIVHPEDRPRVRAHIEESEEVGGPLEIEFRILRRDGAERWIHHVCQAVLTDDGRLLGRRASNRDVTEHKRAEDAVRQLAHFPEENPNPVLRLGVDGALLYANAAARECLAAMGGGADGPVPAALRGLAAAAREQERPVDGELPDERGRIFWFGAVQPPSETYVNLYARDVTERKQAEEDLRKVNRTLRALHNSGQTMMRATQESEYLAEVCRIVVEDCGHAMVWIGFAEEDEEKSVRPAAWSGFEEGYLETLKITWADAERGRGPTGTAIRTGTVATCRNMLTDPAFAPWRAEALRRGYASSIVLPLRGEGRAFGALTIYSREPDPFADDEVALLSELADDLSYGITALRLRQAHAQTEAERERLLEEAETQRARLVAVLRQMPAGVAIADAATGRIVLGNQRLADIWREPAIPATLDEFAIYCRAVHCDGRVYEPADRPLRRVLRDGAPVADEEMEIVRADGTTGTIVVSAAPIRDRADRIVAAVMTSHDVTEMKHLQRELHRANLDLELRVEQRTAQVATANQALRAANEALAESESRFAAFMDRFPGAAFIKDPDGAYVYFNQFCEGAFGWSRARTLGRRDDELFPPDVAARLRAVDQEVLAGGQNREIVEPLAIGGTETTFLTEKFPIPRKGRPPLLGGIALDISDRKRLEREILDISQRTQRRIGQDLHDTLGQQLTGMVFVAEALESKLERKGMPEAADAARLGQLVDQAIRQTRALSRGLCPVQVEADGLMSALEDFAAAIADHSRIDCRFECPKPVLLGDTDAATHLFHIAQEAVNNALKHARPTQIRIGLAASGAEAALIVEDNGAGFSQERPRGDTFGLHIMGYRANMIGGSLDVQSAPGQGTVVTCHFPRRAAEGAAGAGGIPGL